MTFKTLTIAAAALGAAAFFSTSASAGTLRFVESFEDASNEGGWTGGFVFDGIGLGLGEQFVPEGGSGGGAFLFRFADEFIPEVHTTAGLPSIFHGDWRELGVRSFSGDIKMFQYTDFLPDDHTLVVNEQPMTVRERHVTLMLTRDPDPAVRGDECTIVSIGGKHLTSGDANSSSPFIPSSRHDGRGLRPRHVGGEPKGEGWRTFHFSVRASSETMPNTWDVPRLDSDLNGDGFDDFFDNACPADDDEAWRYVTSDVTQVVFRMADPIAEAFGIGQIFAYGVDDMTLVIAD